MSAHVNFQVPLRRKGLVTDQAAERAVPGVSSHVDDQRTGRRERLPANVADVSHPTAAAVVRTSAACRARYSTWTDVRLCIRAARLIRVLLGGDWHQRRRSQICCQRRVSLPILQRDRSVVVVIMLDLDFNIRLRVVG